MSPPQYILTFLLPLALCAGASADDSSTNVAATSPTPAPYEAILLVISVDKGHPTVSSRQTDQLPASRFAGEVVRQWQTNYNSFGEALVEAAQEKHLDSVSLAKILQKLRAAPENKHLAILPVAARSTKFSGESRKARGVWVWDVTLFWGEPERAAEKGELGHIRNFKITQGTLEQVDFRTCY